jgi:hypothetical protein
MRGYKLRNGCTDCGYNAHAEALDFDHRPGEDKAGALSHMSSTHGWGAIMAEIEKCDVVCANCHRVRTKYRKVG